MSVTVGGLARRRAVVRGIIATGLVISLGRTAAAQSDQTAIAVNFIRQAGNELATLVSAAAASHAERPRLQAFLDRVVDVDGVARFCLGRYWAAASGSEQRLYLGVFHRVLLRNVISWLGSHQQGPAHVTIERPLADGQDIDVPTVVERDGDPPAHVAWLVTMSEGGPKIIDTVVEGVSMRLTVRNDYTSFIAHNGGDIEVLIRGLERQADSG
jgi:phospholipid transport system substrate-binding protein